MKKKRITAIWLVDIILADIYLSAAVETSYTGPKSATERSRTNGPCARTLDLPLLVRSSVFSFFFFGLGGEDFWCVFDPFPEEEISDYRAQGPFIRVLTVSYRYRIYYPIRNIGDIRNVLSRSLRGR